MPRIAFRPDLRAIDAPIGERLLVAAWKCGVGIKSVCGGRGKCGSCLVEIESAEAGALSPASEQECQLLPAGDERRKFRLACLCEVHADMVVSVPPESQAVRSAPRKPYTATPMAVEPAVRNVVAAVERGRIEAPSSLTDRLRSAIAAAAGVKRIELGPEVIADFSLHPGFDTAREVTATLYTGRQVAQLRPGRVGAAHGLAIDVGTTSIVLFLCDLAGGDMVAIRTAGNPQAIYGEDVISRMSHIQRDPSTLAEMQRLLVAELNRMLDEAAAEAGIARDDIVDAVLVGNPTMQHILLGVNPEPLGRGPYLPVWSDGVDVEARRLGLAMAPCARVFVFPSVSGYIGGDTLAALLTRGGEFRRGSRLLVDVGTNGEVVLSHNGEFTATSCATGPVYEGAHIRCGVRAAPGAIERIWIEPNGRVRWSVIADEPAGSDRRPLGLCGSGVISGIAALVGAKLLGADGTFVAPTGHPRLRAGDGARTQQMLLVPGTQSRTGRDIVLTQQDVRAVQLGKSALRAGIEILLADRGVTKLDAIYLAGTFGNHLEPDDIVRIGMVPPVAVEQIRSIGNAAGDGARMALFSRRHRARATKLARRIRVLELSGRSDFQELFVLHTALSALPEPLEVD